MLSQLVVVMSDNRWVGDAEQTAYVYYQGKDSSQLQAVRYLGGDPMTASTGEHVIFTKKGIETIPNNRLWVYPEIDEINKKPRLAFLTRLKHKWRGINLTPQDNRATASKPLYPTDEQGSVYAYSVLNNKRSLGQRTDIAAHKKKLEGLQQQHPEIKRIVCYGVSRGSATTFAALANNNYQNVKLCVLEAPPGSVRNLVKSKFPKFIGKLIYNSPLTKWLLGKQHDRNKSAQAQAYVDRFPMDIPLVIISSKADTTVPHDNSLKLAQLVASKRLDANNKGISSAPVYFIQLDKPDHNEYALMTKFPEDVSRYQNTLHAIYKRHNLPYIASLADKGEAYVKDTILTDGFLANQMSLQSQFKAQKSERPSTQAQGLKALNQGQSPRQKSIARSLRMYQDVKPPQTHKIAPEAYQHLKIHP